MRLIPRNECSRPVEIGFCAGVPRRNSSTAGLGRPFQEASEISAQDPDQLLLKAMELYEAGDLEDALELLDKELDGSGRERLIEGHLWALRILCRREIADEVLDEDKEDDTDWTAELLAPGATKEFLLAAGIFMSEEQAFDLAEKVLVSLCEDKNTEQVHVAIFNLALVRERAGRTEEALEGYQETIRIAPAWPHGHLYLARCYRDSGHADEAIAPLEKYLELEPEDLEEWISLAIIHSNAGRFKSADLAYKKAASIDPTSASLNFNRGISARRAKNREQLVRCEEQLSSLAGGDWRASLLRGYLHELDGKMWPAWEAFSEAADLEAFGADEEEAKECAAAHALSFVVEHDMGEQATEIANRCFASFAFSYEILFQLRRLGGRHAIEAFDYGVLIKSDLTDKVAIQELIEEDAIGPPYCFFRNYRIIADSPEAAAKIALEFEERLGGENVEIEEITEVEAVQDVYLGTWWLARELHCFSKHADSEKSNG